MAVWRIPDARNDIDRWYPKPPYVEKRKCKAFRCKNRRSVSFPWIKNNPWCTDHSKQVYFAAERWRTVSGQLQQMEAAKPPTNLVDFLRTKARRKK